MLEGLALIGVALVLIVISRDATQTAAEVDRFLIDGDRRSWPRLRRVWRGAHERLGRVGLWYGWLIGAAGVVGGLILIVRDL